MLILSDYIFYPLQLSKDFEQIAAIEKPAEQQFAAEWEKWSPKIRAYAERELSHALKGKLQRLAGVNDDGMYLCWCF